MPVLKLTMLKQAEIQTKLHANKAQLATFGVVKLSLFGSAVRKQATPTSDLDFLVELSPKTFRNYMGLKLFLEDLFGCSVDLVITSSLKATIREQVLTEARRVA